MKDSKMEGEDDPALNTPPNVIADDNYKKEVHSALLWSCWLHSLLIPSLMCFSLLILLPLKIIASV
jgi:hypothetical protein